MRRLTSSFKEQHWMTIGIELIIVIIGVFIGTQVSNWNQQRIEKRESRQMLVQLIPELQNQLDFFDSARTYYATTRRYADVAFAGWNNDPRVSDEQFVIAAYQASQVVGIGTNAVNWTTIFGGDRLHNIDDPRIRRNLGLVMSADYDSVKLTAVATTYREQVRHIIPADLQDRIRGACGDRTPAGSFVTELPPTCTLPISPAQAASTAAALRARRDLPGELNWHLAAVATFLGNAALFEGPIRSLLADLKHEA